MKPRRKNRILRRVAITFGIVIAVMSGCLLMIPKVLTSYYLNRTELKPKRDLIELRNDTTGRSIVLVGMGHIGKPEFYEFVKNLTDSLKTEGYFIYFEVVGKSRSMDSLTLDTLERKMRKVMGFHLTNYIDEDNRSRRAYNPKKYVEQDYEYLGRTAGDSCWVHADYMLSDLIEKYEQDKGEIILTEYDWDTPLMEKYDARKSGDSTTYDRYYFTNTLRNEKVTDMLLSSPHKKILVLYGAKHIWQINSKKLKDSLQLTDEWDRERVTKEQAVALKH